MQNSIIVPTDWKIVGGEHKILAIKYKNSNNIPNTSYRMQKSSSIIQNNSCKTDKNYSYRYKIPLQNYKIVLPEWKIDGSRTQNTCYKKHKNSNNIPNTSCIIQKVQNPKKKLNPK